MSDFFKVSSLCKKMWRNTHNTTWTRKFFLWFDNANLSGFLRRVCPPFTCGQLHFPVIRADSVGSRCCGVHRVCTKKRLLRSNCLPMPSFSLLRLVNPTANCLSQDTHRGPVLVCRRVARSICNSTAVRWHAALCTADASCNESCGDFSSITSPLRVVCLTAGPNGSAVRSARMSSQTPPRAARVSALEGCTVCRSFLRSAQHKVTSWTATVAPSAHPATPSAKKPRSYQRQPLKIEGCAEVMPWPSSSPCLFE